MRSNHLCHSGRRPLENYTQIVNKFLGFVSVVVQCRAPHKPREPCVEFCPDLGLRCVQCVALAAARRRRRPRTTDAHIGPYAKCILGKNATRQRARGRTLRVDASVFDHACRMGRPQSGTRDASERRRAGHFDLSLCIARPEREVMTHSVFSHVVQSALTIDLSCPRFQAPLPLMAAKYSIGAGVWFERTRRR